MRLIPAFFVLVAISTTVFACPGGVEPAFDMMIRASTLIVRGQVLSETGDNQWNAQNQKQHWSDVLIERTYKGASSGGIRVSWKDRHTNGNVGSQVRDIRRNGP